MIAAISKDTPGMPIAIVKTTQSKITADTICLEAEVAVLTGCLTEKQAYASIDCVTIFLFAGMMLSLIHI